uniref:Protein kinase domain-containing protein n=1 Tax=Mycena chlorophos TaxID=658473 RepID=A0ABQ0L6Y8_MYCCL|nr:predicted protein [Mycena chlorophos]
MTSNAMDVDMQETQKVSAESRQEPALFGCFIPHHNMRTTRATYSTLKSLERDCFELREDMSMWAIRREMLRGDKGGALPTILLSDDLMIALFFHGERLCLNLFPLGREGEAKLKRVTGGPGAGLILHFQRPEINAYIQVHRIQNPGLIRTISSTHVKDGDWLSFSNEHAKWTQELMADCTSLIFHDLTIPGRKILAQYKIDAEQCELYGGESHKLTRIPPKTPTSPIRPLAFGSPKKKSASGSLANMFSPNPFALHGHVYVVKTITCPHDDSGSKVPDELIILEHVRLAQNPNTCQLYDYFLNQDKSYDLVIQVLDGRTLADVLAERNGLGLTERKTKAIIRALCDALGSLHSRGIVHRNLKLSTVLVNVKGGQVQITDFGRACEVDHNGAVIFDAAGPEEYDANEDEDAGEEDGDAPENTTQYDENAAYYDVDSPAHDLRALGLITWKCLAGDRHSLYIQRRNPHKDFSKRRAEREQARRITLATQSLSQIIVGHDLDNDPIQLNRFGIDFIRGFVKPEERVGSQSGIPLTIRDALVHEWLY